MKSSRTFLQIIDEACPKARFDRFAVSRWLECRRQFSIDSLTSNIQCDIRSSEKILSQAIKAKTLTKETLFLCPRHSKVLARVAVARASELKTLVCPTCELEGEDFEYRASLLPVIEAFGLR